MRPWLKTAFSVSLVFLLAGAGFSQFYYVPYYGKNKVQYDQFRWQKYSTDHFDLYYYAAQPQVLKFLAEMCESAYSRISQELKHQLTIHVPIIYYNTYTEFEQTNLFQVPEGVLGVAEPILYRIAIYGDQPLDELQDLIEHELTHVFEFDVLWGTPGGRLYALNEPPGWVMEGYAEYSTRKWSNWSAMIVRDATLNDRIPEFSESGELVNRYPLPRPPDYDFGHAIYEFIEQRFGKNGIREFWTAMKSTPLLGRIEPAKKAFKMKLKEFNYEFKKYLRARTKDYLLRENPENYSFALGPEFPINSYYFVFSYDLSPSGDIVAAITYNVKDNDIDIVLISTKDGSIIKNITGGYANQYEQIKYGADASRGKNIAWSRDGDELAFFARDGKKYSLFIVDALTGSILEKAKIPEDEPYGPSFYPDGRALVYTAFTAGLQDIFKVDLATKKITNLTQDELFEKAPDISPDGKFVAYCLRLEGTDKLFLSPLDDMKKKTQLTFGKGNAISPRFSSDSRIIYFSADMKDAFNIYSLSLDSGELQRYTDVRTGNFFPIPLPNVPNAVVFSSFNKGAFQIFKSERTGQPEGTLQFTEFKPEEQERATRFEPVVTLEIEKDKIQAYKGMGQLYLMARPPLDAIVSTDGSIYGGSAVTFSDLMGDYNFSLVVYQVRSFRSYYFAFINQKSRIQWMANAYQYTLFYYPPYSYYDPTLYNYLSYRDAVASRQISGASIAAFYPFNKFYRAEAAFQYSHYEEDFADPAALYYGGGMGRGYNYFWNGNILSASFSLVGETTRFKYYGPAAGQTFRIALTQPLPVSQSFFKNTTVEADLRKYLPIGSDILLAFRFEGFASWGRNPFVFYFGGNNQVRSSYYYNIIGTEAWYANVELRVPLVNAASTIIGQIGPVRGVFFFDIARANIKGAKYPWTFYSLNGPFGTDPTGHEYPPSLEAIGSFGYGLQFFFLGLPVHVEFTKRLEFSNISNPFRFKPVGSYETKFWIGFDF